MEDHVDDYVKMDYAHPEVDKMEVDTASFSSTKLANGDEDDVTMHAMSSDPSVSLLCWMSLESY